MAFSFTYRGIRSEDLKISILNITRSILPPSDVKIIDIPGRAGDFFLRSEYGVRTFAIEILIEKQATREEIQDQTLKIANFLDSGPGLGELIFDDDTTRSYQAIISEFTDVEQITTFRRGIITFIAPFPFSQSLNDQEFTINGFQSTFTRASVAYNLDGEIVGTGVPRYWPAVFGEGIIIEEGTTNLLSTDLSSFESSTAGMVGNGAAIDRDIKHAFQGSFSLKVLTDGAATQEGTQTSLITGISPSTTYSFSVYAIANQASTLLIEVEEFTAVDAFITNTLSTVFNINDEEGDLVRLYHTFTTTGTTAKIRVRILTNTLQYITFWIDGLQLEQKNYITSWRQGGFTRNAETLTVPIANYMKNLNIVKEGTIQMNIARINPSSGTFAGLFDWGAFDAGNAKDRIAIFHGTSQPSGLQGFTLSIVNGSTTTADTLTVTLPAITAQLQFYHVAARWSLPGTMEIDVYDYTTKTLYSNSKSSTLTPPTMTFPVTYSTAEIGSIASSFWVNAIYDEFRATRRRRSDNEIASDVVAVRPLPMDEEGVLKLTFDSSFELYNTDLTNIGSAPTQPDIKIVVITAATFVQAENTVTGQILRAEGSFNPGDVIVFDVTQKIVFLNGAANMPLLTLSSEFFQLSKDDISINTTSDGTIKSSVQYIPNWL